MINVISFQQTSVSLPSHYSGTTLLAGGNVGTLTWQGPLPTRWVVVWSRIQGKGSDYSLTHKLGPTQVFLCFFH